MLTVLFVVSFAGIIYLIAVKVYEIKSDTTTPMTRTLSHFDEKVIAHLEIIGGHYKRGTNKASALIQTELMEQSKEVSMRLKNATRQAYQVILPNVRGKRVFKKDREASAFLKHISDHQEQNGKGRIEDEGINNEQ